MRSQEAIKIKKLCHRYDLDWMEYDLRNEDYHETKMQILKMAGVRNEETVKEDYLRWAAVAEYSDSLSFEEKTFIPEGFVGNAEFLNCLVIQFSQRHFKFAVDILSKTFKGNFMSRTDRVLRIRSTVRILWFMGLKETTNRIQDELSKHNVWFRVMRDSYLRRDFAHYHNGKIYSLSKKQFRELTQKASLKEEQKIIAQ